MATNFPGSLDTFVNPASGNTLDSPSHSLQHSDINDAVEAIETKLGIGTATPGTATAYFPLVAGTAGATSWTQLTAAGITSGTATSGQVLAANGSGAVSWSTPASKILQVVNATYSTTTSTTSTSYITTGITTSITPSSTSNKILIIAQVPTKKTSNNVYSGAVTALFRGTVAGTNLSTNQVYADTPAIGTITYAYLDSPNTTSSQTYTIGLKTDSNLTTVETCPFSAVASITLLEVAV